MLPSRSSLEAILRNCGFPLEPEQYDKLWGYHRLLREANAELNLTRIHQFDNMVLKHYVDCLLPLRYTDLPSPLIDMGSGPGLPGIPLKIARPDIEMILAEPRGSRAEFLKMVIEKLELKGIEVVARKINASFPHKAKGVITRAVAAIPETLDRVATCLEIGSRMIFMKGPDCDDEIAEALATRSEAFRLVTDRAYNIPHTEHKRRIVVYERLEGAVPTSVNVPLVPQYAGPIREVSSDANPTLKVLRDILQGRGIRKHGQALMAGSRIVSEVLANHPEEAVAWVTDLEGLPPPEGSKPGLEWFRLSTALFSEIDTSGTKSPLLLVKVPTLSAWSAEAEWPDGCTLFVPFQDPENVGATIRSAAAFGVSRVVLLRESAHPFHPKSARAAGPALFSVEIQTGPALNELAAESAPIYSLSAEGEPLPNHQFPVKFGLVAGLEGPGLPDNLRSGTSLRIPIAPGVESLNAATSVAIALYQWRLKCSLGDITPPPAQDIG